MFRRILRALALLPILALPHVTLALLLLRFALGQGVATSRIADAVADTLDCRAHLDDSIVTYFASSSALGLRLFADGEDEPFLVAGRAETDLNAARFLLRRPLYRIDLYDVDVRLRFDREGRLLTAFKDQTRFKPIDLSLAEAENVYSRFLVAPTRASPTKGTIRGHDALASGGLGGFLGFFSEAYRHHDFVHGRVNCRSFLRDAFALPISESGPRNPIFDSWQPALVAPDSPFLCGGRPAHGQIIPLVGALAQRTEDLSWPMDAFSGYDAVQAAIERRVHALYPALRDSLLKRLGFGATLRFLARAYLWLPWFFARRKLIAKLRHTIDGAANKVKLRG